MFGLSPSELMVVGVIAVVLFGRNLPSVARSAGRSLTEFRRGMQDLQHEFNDSMREAERAATVAATLPGPDEPYRDDAQGDEAYDPPPEEEPVAAEADSPEQARAN